MDPDFVEQDEISSTAALLSEDDREDVTAVVQTHLPRSDGDAPTRVGQTHCATAAVLLLLYRAPRQQAERLCCWTAGNPAGLHRRRRRATY